MKRSLKDFLQKRSRRECYEAGVMAERQRIIGMLKNTKTAALEVFRNYLFDQGSYIPNPYHVGNEKQAPPPTYKRDRESRGAIFRQPFHVVRRTSATELDVQLERSCKAVHFKLTEEMVDAIWEVSNMDVSINIFKTIRFRRDRYDLPKGFRPTDDTKKN